jgi:hypothetical protein
MKKLSFILAIAILLAGGAAAVRSAPSYAQAYEYPPPPVNLYDNPWVGPNTPWIYYNGDWFLNGILYYFFGPQYGWAPYYAYPSSYMVRPQNWYAPRWHAWYQGNPHYWQSFQRAHPYWRGHRAGQRYEKNFYEKHHRGHGDGWQKGYHGATFDRSRPEKRKPDATRVTPSERRKPDSARVAPSKEKKGVPGGSAGPAHKPQKAHPGGKKPEKTGPGAEKP